MTLLYASYRHRMPVLGSFNDHLMIFLETIRCFFSAQCRVMSILYLLYGHSICTLSSSYARPRIIQWYLYDFPRNHHPFILRGHALAVHPMAIQWPPNSHSLHTACQHVCVSSIFLYPMVLVKPEAMLCRSFYGPSRIFLMVLHHIPPLCPSFFG